MEKETWQVKVNNIDYALDSQVYIYRFRGKEIQILSIVNGGITILTYPSNGSAIPATFTGRTEDIKEIVKGFLAYAYSQGFKNQDETFAKGKLEATEAHLSDMRQLLKLK